MCRRSWKRTARGTLAASRTSGQSASSAVSRWEDEAEVRAHAATLALVSLRLDGLTRGHEEPDLARLATLRWLAPAVANVKHVAIEIEVFPAQHAQLDRAKAAEDRR